MLSRLAATSIVLLAACVPIQGAGEEELEPIGAFALSAELDSTSCGKASDVSFAPTIEIEVSLSRLGRSLIWEVGRSRWVGTLDEDERSFVVRSAYEVDVTLESEDPNDERAGCVVRRVEEIRGKLDEDDKSFAGSIAYRYEAREGSDCGPELSAKPPLVEKLPCDAKYEARGELTRRE
jgi:hypothetical protein